MKKQNITSSNSKPPIRQQTVFGKSTDNYVSVASLSKRKAAQSNTSRLNLPLETDGLATCLVFY
jgi:hypothetical protein